MQCLIVAGEDIDTEADAADMSQEWVGLGLKSRYEDLNIYCTAIGRAPAPGDARRLALAVVEATGEHLVIKPTQESYNALVSAVERVRATVAQSGVTCRVTFVISAKARLL